MEAISKLKSAIKDLEVGLLKLNKPTYDNIDALMRKIMKTYDVTAKELHHGFRDKHQNQTPDEWVSKNKKMKTFKEFLEEAYLYEGFSSPEEGHTYAKENPPFGGAPYRLKQKARKGQPRVWRFVRADKRSEQERRRRERAKQNYTNKTKTKEDLAKERGLEVHHVEPLHSNPKNSAQNNLHLGGDRRNISLVTPEQHRFYHDVLERKFKKIIQNSGGSISLRDLVAAYERQKKKAERRQRITS